MSASIEKALKFLNKYIVSRKWKDKPPPTLNLERSIELAESMDVCLDSPSIVHVAGTKGKGSTVRFMGSILISSGYNTGEFSSPQVRRINDRIRFNKTEISDDELYELTKLAEPYMSQFTLPPPTVFGILTCIGLKHLQSKKSDFIILEVGMGGRFDTTNIVSPAVCAITNIALEHTEQLGDTLPKIAFEKAGIIKEGIPVVTAIEDSEPLDEVIKKAKEMNAPLKILGNDILLDGSRNNFSVRIGENVYDNLKIKAYGDHQLKNAALAVAMADELLSKGYKKITVDSVRQGLYEANLPGRVEYQNTQDHQIILDGAHTGESVDALIKTIKNEFKYQKLFMVVVIQDDKNAKKILEHIVSSGAEIIFTKSENPNAFLPEELLEMAGNTGLVKDSVKEAVAYVMSESAPEDLICFTGSFSLISEARNFLLAK